MDLKMISNDLRSSCRALLIGAYQDGGGEGKDSIFHEILNTGIPAATIKVTDRFKYVVMVWENKYCQVARPLLRGYCEYVCETTRFNTDTGKYDNESGYDELTAIPSRQLHQVTTLYDNDTPLLVRIGNTNNSSYTLKPDTRNYKVYKDYSYLDPSIQQGSYLPEIENVLVIHEIYDDKISVEYAGDFELDKSNFNTSNGTFAPKNFTISDKDGNGFSSIKCSTKYSYYGSYQPRVEIPPYGLQIDRTVRPIVEKLNEYTRDFELGAPLTYGGFEPTLSSYYNVYPTFNNIFTDMSINDLAELDAQIWKSICKTYGDKRMSTVKKLLVLP